MDTTTRIETLEKKLQRTQTNLTITIIAMMILMSKVLL